MKDTSYFGFIGFYSIAFGICACLISSAHAKDGIDTKTMLSAAIKNLHEEVSNSQIIFKYKQSVYWNNVEEVTKTGTKTFVSFGEFKLSDSRVVTPQYDSVRYGKTFRKTSDSTQFVIRPNKKMIGVRYNSANDKFQSLRHVFYTKSYKSQDDFLVLLANGSFENIYYAPSPLGANITDIMKLSAKSVSKSSSKQEITYALDVGELKIVINFLFGKYLIESILLTQTAADKCMHDKVDTLRQMSESRIGKNSNGLMLCRYSTSFTHKIIGGDVRISTIDSETTEQSSEASLTFRTNLVLSQYNKISSEAEFNTIAIPIPEGEKVYPVNDELSKVELTYRDKEIVREIDGASLEQVTVENKNRNRLWTILSIIASLLVVVGTGCFTFYLLRKKLFKTGGNP